MIYYTISTVLSAFLSFSLGVFIFSRNPKGNINRSFLYLSLSLAFWSISLFFNIIAPTKDIALLWVRILHAFAIFVPVTFLHFVYAITGEFLKREQLIKILYFVGVIFLVLDFTPFFVNVIFRPNFNFFVAQPKIIYPVFLMFFIVCVTYSILKLFFTYKSSSGIKQIQLRYLFLAALIGSIGGCSNYLINFNIKIIPFYPFGNYLTAAYVLIMAYAILRHRLMDIEVVIKKGMVYSSVSFFLIIAYLAIITASEYLFRNIAGYSTIWVSIPTVFVLALLFNPLRERIQGFVDRRFFRERYEYQMIFKAYADTLIKPLPLNKLAIRVPYVVYATMNLSRAFSIILDRKSNVYRIEGAAGKLKDRKNLYGVTFRGAEHPIFGELKKRKKAIVYEEIVRELTTEPLKPEEKKKSESIKTWMENYGVAILLPSVSEQGELIGVLALGEKLSGEPFSAEDIRFFEELSPTITGAIERTFMTMDTVEKMFGMEKLATMGTITASVAHEIKNAFNYIYTLSQVLPVKWDSPEFKQKTAKSFPAEAERIRILLEGMLNYSKPTPPRLEMIDIVKDSIKEVTPLISDEMKKFNVGLKQEYEECPKIHADKNRMKQVFLNLMINAVHAMPKGGELKVLVKKEEEALKIQISDTGTGIPKEKLGEIFDPFYTTKEGGTGLGLPIVKRIIDEHKGTIKVESEVEKGAVFTITLPLS